MTLRVAIAGAGPGGLCLAQGLRRAGVEAVVFERDGSPGERRQGYRLHLDARAGLALEKCLPSDLFELFLATCSLPSRGFTVVSERLRPLHAVAGTPGVDPYSAATLATSVNRQTLREVLAARVDVRFGHPVVGYSTDGDSCIRVSFADGSSFTADVLVAADGVRSAVREQYLPAAVVTDSGGRCVYGKTPLTAEALALVPPQLLDGFMAVIGGRIGMATGLVRHRTPVDSAPAGIAPDVRLTPSADYMMWSLAGQVGQFPGGDSALSAMSPGELHAMVRALIKSWHPNLRALVDLADIAETFLIKVRTSTPIEPWAPSRVTVLGDTIHAMSPARGSGANTALQDAASLCAALAGATPDALLAAIGSYEADLRERGYAAVAASRQAEAEAAARGDSLMFRLARRLAR